MKRAIPEASALAFVVGVRGVASALVIASGFRAVSDDDFARVVIAEQWVSDPRWDASRTSWLPAPFWVSGIAMKLAGCGIDTARAVSLALGVVAALVVYRSARWIGEEPATAALCAAAASVFPWSARLGVATVPELPAAALTLLAAASLVDLSPRRRVLGGAALLAATLSRYEAWPVALAFAAFCAMDLAAAKSRRSRLWLAASATLGVTGPVAWILANRVTHGDALHFLARVAAYRQALGASSDSGFVRVVAYPRALVQEAPELVALLCAGAVLSILTRIGWHRLNGYKRPLVLVACQIAALSFAMMKDGAPTHHPERAMLTAMLLLAVLGVGLVARGAGALPTRSRKAVASVATTAFLAACVASPKGDLAHRSDESAIGEAAARHLDTGARAHAKCCARALVEVRDYGFLAVQAGAGNPELVVADRSIDPRDPPTPSSFDTEPALAARVAESGVSWVIARRSSVAAFTNLEPAELAGAFGLYRVSMPQ